MTQDYFSTHKLYLAVAALLLLPVLLLSVRLQTPWDILLALAYSLSLTTLWWRIRRTLRRIQMENHE